MLVEGDADWIQFAMCPDGFRADGKEEDDEMKTETQAAYDHAHAKEVGADAALTGDHDNMTSDTGFVAQAIRTANTHANGHGVAEEATHTLDCANGQAVGVDFYNNNLTGETAKTLNSAATDRDHAGGVLEPSALEPTARVRSVVRRLTPLECERLMGLPDGYTACMGADSPRYKACGNGWATNCARWILRRIAARDLLDGYPEEHTYATVCSGIECCSAALRGMPWTPVFFSEIEKAPSALLAHHYPTVPNLGDMTKIEVHHGRRITNGTVSFFVPENGIDVFAGGTPCQDVSVAGKRAGMQEGSGTRSSLAFTFVRLVAEIRPRWVVWENVPGCLSSNGGRDFARFVRQIGELGYACGWRTLDAQYTRVDQFPFAIPQRRRRVWLVGHLGADHRAVETVLFEHPGLLGDTPPRRETGKGAAAGTQGGAGVPDRMDAGGVAWRGERGDAVRDLPVSAEAHAKGEVPDRLAGRCGAISSGGDAADTIDASYFKGHGFRGGARTDGSGVAGSLCASDGKGKNGQDAYNGKLVW